MKLFFTAYRTQSQGGYAHAHLELFVPNAVERSCPRPFLTFEWQTDSDTAKWYGVHAQARTEYGDCGLKPAEQFRKAASILDKFPTTESPLDYAAMLQGAGIVRRVYDCRVSQYLLPDEVHNESYRRWIACDDSGSCIASVVCSSEERAKLELLKELGKRIAEPCFRSPESAQKELQKWMNDGQPVRVTNEVKPDVRPLPELFLPLGRQAIPA